jgi:hypothetical protein
VELQILTSEQHWLQIKHHQCKSSTTAANQAPPLSYVIYYSGHAAVLEGYSDLNWISDVADLYVTSRYVFTFGGGAVS